MISTFLERVMEEELSFGQLEKLLWKSTLSLFQHVMVEVLEQFDQILMENRDKSRFENKEKNPRSVQTMVGSVDFERRYYWDTEEHRWVYLLDEALELEPEKTIGPGLLQLAVTWATKGPSYRDARDRLIDLYGAQVLSHEAIRQALLEVAASCERVQQNRIARDVGKREVEALFIEVDGFGARFQKNKKHGRRNQRHEVKMAVIHEGWEPRHKGKNPDYRLVSPTFVSNLDVAEDFWEQIRGTVHAKYRNVDSIPIIVNGDGAEWIRNGAVFAKGMYQYDRFHVARDIRSALRLDKNALRKAQKALRKNDMGGLLCVVTEAWVDCTDEGKKEELNELKDLILKNHEYIVDYRKRLRDGGFDAPAEWRGLGAAESNVNKFKNRTAKRGRSWSPEGLGAILTTLTHLFEGTLQENISRILPDAEEWLLDKVTDGAGHIVTRAQSSLTGAKRGSLPATRHGTRGFSKLFNRLHLVDPS